MVQIFRQMRVVRSQNRNVQLFAVIYTTQSRYFGIGWYILRQKVEHSDFGFLPHAFAEIFAPLRFWSPRTFIVGIAQRCPQPSRTEFVYFYSNGGGTQKPRDRSGRFVAAGRRY